MTFNRMQAFIWIPLAATKTHKGGPRVQDYTHRLVLSSSQKTFNRWRKEDNPPWTSKSSLSCHKKRKRRQLFDWEVGTCMSVFFNIHSLRTSDAGLPDSTGTGQLFDCSSDASRTWNVRKTQTYHLQACLNSSSFTGSSPQTGESKWWGVLIGPLRLEGLSLCLVF